MRRALRKFGVVSEKTSRNMKKIKSRDTSIELSLRKALWHKGYRYRKNYKVLPGSPDIAITKYKIAIFCDSEFFHGKDWEKLESRLRKGKNPDYWIAHIEENMARDRRNDKLLKFEGWTVIHFWGKELKKDSDACVRVIEEAIFDNMMSQEENLDDDN
jgi:DNA mismatch endonuclease (patch repair protein)